MAEWVDQREVMEGQQVAMVEVLMRPLVSLQVQGELVV